MVQSINTKALMTLASVVRKPSLIVPHVSVATVSHLNFTALQEHAGIAAVVFDKDNTLTAPYEATVHAQAARGLHECLTVFGRDRVAVLSNSAGTDDDVGHVDAIRLEFTLGIPVIRHRVKKPGGMDEVLQHFGLHDAAQVCVVGDRLLTDIVFGNLHGMLTVHVLPLTDQVPDGDAAAAPLPTRDNWTARMLRPMENVILYKNWWGGRALQQRRPGHKTWDGRQSLVLLEQPAVDKAGNIMTNDTTRAPSESSPGANGTVSHAGNEKK